MREVGKYYIARDSSNKGFEIIVKCTSPIGSQFGTFSGIVVKSNDPNWAVGTPSGFWTNHNGVLEETEYNEQK